MSRLNFKSVPVKASEITPEHIYLSRRQFLQTLGIVGSGALLAACATPEAKSPAEASNSTRTEGSSDELGDALNTYEEITNYNNYYEFTTDKQDVAKLAKDFKTSPWEVQVYGLVNNPKTYAVEDLLKKFTQEERIYRLRCVEAW